MRKDLYLFEKKIMSKLNIYLKFVLVYLVKNRESCLMKIIILIFVILYFIYIEY